MQPPIEELDSSRVHLSRVCLAPGDSTDRSLSLPLRLESNPAGGRSRPPTGNSIQRLARFDYGFLLAAEMSEELPCVAAVPPLIHAPVYVLMSG